MLALELSCCQTGSNVGVGRAKRVRDGLGAKQQQGGHGGGGGEHRVLTAGTTGFVFPQALVNAPKATAK